MKRPSFQFYPADWQANSNLRRCSRVEKSIWLDVLFLLHDSEEYGVLRWNLKELAEAAHCKPSELKALRDKGVLKGAEKGESCEAFIYVPRSGRKDGAPVTLIAEQTGPIWYSSRMVRDEYVRTIRGEGTRFGESPKGGIGEVSSGSPTPRKGDGSTASTSSTASTTNLKDGGNSTDAVNPATVRPADLSLAMRRHSIDAHPGDPRIIAAAKAGLSVETVDAACLEAKAAKPNERLGPAYVLKIAERWTRESVAPSAGYRAGAPPKPNASRQASRDESRAAAAASIGLGVRSNGHEQHDFIDAECHFVE